MVNSETSNKLYSKNSRDTEPIYRNVILQRFFKDSPFQQYTFQRHISLEQVHINTSQKSERPLKWNYITGWDNRNKFISACENVQIYWILKVSNILYFSYSKVCPEFLEKHPTVKKPWKKNPDTWKYSNGTSIRDGSECWKDTNLHKGETEKNINVFLQGFWNSKYHLN